MTRQPGPIPASEEIARALALAMALAIRRVLPDHRERAAGELAIEAVARVERELETRLHDDVLVLVALADAGVARAAGIDGLASIAEAAEDARDVADWVRIATVEDHQLEVRGARGGALLSVYAPRDPDDSVAARVRIAVDGGAPGEDELVLGTWIYDRLRSVLERRGDALAILAAARELTAIEPEPRWVHEVVRAAPVAALLGKVRHPTFGVGDVVSRTGAGDGAKLVVRFATGDKTILARFVTPAD